MHLLSPQGQHLCPHRASVSPNRGQLDPLASEDPCLTLAFVTLAKTLGVPGSQGWGRLVVWRISAQAILMATRQSRNELRDKRGYPEVLLAAQADVRSYFLDTLMTLVNRPERE